MLRITLVLTAIILVGAAQADTGPPLPIDWKGMFTTDTVGGCSIVKSGAVLRHTNFGYGYIGKDVSFGMLEMVASDDAMTTLENELAYKVGQAGFNGLVGLRYELNHTADAVYEGGTTWRNGADKVFDYAGTFTALIYGTPVKLECE